MIFNSIFEDSFLTNITWTGRSGTKNQKKIVLKSCTNIVQLLKDLCIASDEKYTAEKCEKAIVYKVLKYAYRKKKDSETSTDSDVKAQSTSTKQALMNDSSKDISNIDSAQNEKSISIEQMMTHQQALLSNASQHLEEKAPDMTQQKPPYTFDSALTPYPVHPAILHGMVPPYGLQAYGLHPNLNSWRK